MLHSRARAITLLCHYGLTIIPFRVYCYFLRKLASGKWWRKALYCDAFTVQNDTPSISRLLILGLILCSWTTANDQYSLPVFVFLIGINSQYWYDRITNEDDVFFNGFVITTTTTTTTAYYIELFEYKQFVNLCAKRNGLFLGLRGCIQETSLLMGNNSDVTFRILCTLPSGTYVRR